MKIDVKHVAKLANLDLDKDGIKKFEIQLSSILDYIEKLQEVNTKDLKETSQVTGLENITRKDETKPSLSQEEVLSNAKSKHNGFFRVKAIFEEQT
ncbi:MAG: Asp-tRNA(Asn)/Glu-tRNA(Gln) amidotransferase subunit GatC [Actinobacteria bacterium]|nr:Asp-tRNA(Asn)/Glu-tRNA(Gln) amidotransferase subunit GatC [Actinomycetota bacterium]